MKIRDVIQQARNFILNTDFNELSERELKEKDEVDLLNKHESVETILCMVQAIRKVQGTSRIYLGEGLRDEEKCLSKLDDLGESLIQIYSEIKSRKEKMLTRVEFVDILRSMKQDENDYYNFVSILSSLDLITSVGKGRIGGVKLYDIKEEQKEIQNAEKIIQESKDKEKAKDEHEKALYDSAAKVLSNEGYQAITLGVRRRFSGEWNTPDVMGHRIAKYSVIGGADIELVTIEVKWDVSKQAIAEANSHQKFSNKSFLFVSQNFQDIGEKYIRELIEKGIGLICKHDKSYKIFIPPRENNPDLRRVDNFLKGALEPDDIRQIKIELAKQYYLDFYEPLILR